MERIEKVKLLTSDLTSKEITMNKKIIERVALVVSNKRMKLRKKMKKQIGDFNKRVLIEKEKMQGQIKRQYIDNVFLTDKEYIELVNKFGKKNTNKLIKKFDEYITKTGVWWKSHYNILIHIVGNNGGIIQSIKILDERIREQTKELYGSNVFLTSIQYNRLASKFSKEEANKLIKKFGEYIIRTKEVHSSHYASIISTVTGVGGVTQSIENWNKKMQRQKGQIGVYKDSIFEESQIERIRERDKAKLLSKKGVVINDNHFASKFFSHFNKQLDKEGQYTEKGGERAVFYVRKKCYLLDYINDYLKLIIEWNEPHHYDANGDLSKYDIVRQKRVMKCYPDYDYIIIRENAWFSNGRIEDIEIFDKIIEYIRIKRSKANNIGVF